MTDTGGPAFPNSRDEGMTMLDWFAGQALAGLCTRSGSSGPELTAGVSYQYAEAMIAEKRKREASHDQA